MKRRCLKCIYRISLEEDAKTCKLINTKKKLKLKNNRYVYLKLNRRNASLIINSLALTRRFLYYRKVEQIPVELYFDKNNFEDDMFDLDISINKITQDCKKNFYNWKEYKIYKK